MRYKIHAVPKFSIVVYDYIFVYFFWFFGFVSDHYKKNCLGAEFVYCLQDQDFIPDTKKNAVDSTFKKCWILILEPVLRIRI